MVGFGRIAAGCAGWLGCLVSIGCGPSSTTTASGSGGSGSAEDTTDGESASGGQLDSTGPDASTTNAVDSSGTSGDSTGGELDTCPPRTLEGSGFIAWRAYVDGRVDFTGPPQADCVFDQVAAVPPDPYPMALDFSCTLPDGQAIALTLALRVEVDPVPFEPGAALTWETATEVCCDSNDQTFMTLREPDGTLRLAGFNGFAPEGIRGGDGAQELIEPISMSMVPDVCLPCEEPDCATRIAVDVTVGDAEPVRMIDGTVADVGVDPVFRTYLVTAETTVGGFGGPGESVTAVFVRLP